MTEQIISDQAQPTVVRRRARPAHVPGTPVPDPTPAPVAAAPQPVSFPAPVPASAGAPPTPFKPKSSGAVAPPQRVTPEERVDADSAWNLTDLASACPNPRLDATARLDPYWDGSWTGSSPSWVTRDLASRQQSARLSRVPSRMLVDPAAALERMTRTRDLSEQVALLGSLHSWRTCSTEQLAALTGNADLIAPGNVLTSAAFCSDLVDVAPVPGAVALSERFGRGLMLRPSLSSTFEQTVKPRLTWAEWLAVTGGQTWSSGTQFDRHNLLATELGLRIAEYTDVATVLGERFSTVDLLAGSGVGLPTRPPTDRRSGDLTAVRLDGLRVAIEVTATVSPFFDKKVEKWVQLLAETPMDESGLVVVFLVATPPSMSSSARSVSSVRTATYQAIARAVKQFPGVSFDRTAARIGVATWREWFPAPHKAADSFLGLRVDRPTGPEGADLWQPVDLMDFNAMPFAPRDTDDLKAVIDNAGGLGQTPYWLRAHTKPPTFIGNMLSAVGLSDIPRPDSKRPERVNGRPHGHGVGASGKWKVPPRLLGLAKALNE